MTEEKRDLVCFASAFRQDGSRGGVESPNITHATLDGVKTLCGRSGWVTSEGWHDMGPGCNRCRAGLEAAARRAPTQRELHLARIRELAAKHEWEVLEDGILEGTQAHRLYMSRVTGEGTLAYTHAAVHVFIGPRGGVEGVFHFHTIGSDREERKLDALQVHSRLYVYGK